MNKKLMAVAVAGAFALPGAAMAQTSTVQMYGLFNVEYAPWVDQPNHSSGVGRTNVDALNSGASRIGFRGQEKLGSGLTVWFQCETTVSPLNGAAPADDAEVYDNTSDSRWCDRNSALGLRGGWGNFYIGNWDSPAKRVTSATRMLNETGWLGVQRHLMTLAGWGYSHRVTRSINYDSPNFGGFSVALQTTTNDADKNQLDTATAPGSATGTGAGTDGRIYGINGMYRGGPLVAGLAYQRYQSNIQFAVGGFPSVGGIAGTEDEIIVFGINYTFGAFKIGGVVTNLEAERAPGGTADFERRNYNLALDWTIAGPHKMRFGWTHVGETEGTGASPVTSGSANVWQVAYIHSFSKRTSGAIGWITVDNGDGGVHSLQGLSGNMVPGERSSALSLQLTHSF